MPRRLRPIVVHPPALREVTVLRIAEVTPNLRRVTFTGDQLGGFSPGEGAVVPPFVSSGFDDDINLIFPYPGETEPVLPHFVEGRWVAPPGRRPLGRHYTVRRHDPSTRELDVEFVRHGVGVAASWAWRARPGDVLHLGGPSSSQSLPEGFDWLLVAGDDTAVPAVARLLEELPDAARAQVFLEVARASDRQTLRDLPGVTVRWLVREDPGAPLLLDAVRSAGWWDGSAFAWVAGEQSVVRDLRRHLVDVRELPKDHIDFVGYWKRTAAVATTDDPSLPQALQAEEAEERVHQQSQLLPPLALRLAVELGIGELLVDGVDTAAALAARTGTVEWALRKFLRYLETIGILTSEADRYALTDSGEELTQDWMIEMLRPGGVAAQLEQGFRGLGEAVRTGQASLAAVTGRDFVDLRSDPDFERSFLDDRADGAEYLAAPLAAARALGGIDHLVVHSDIAGAVAAAVTGTHPLARITIVASAAQATWLADDLPRTLTGVDAGRVRVVEKSQADTIGPVDAVLLVDRLAQQTDLAAAQLLRRVADSVVPGGRVLVFEETLDVDDVDDHEAEIDLLNLTVHGSGFRSDAELEALVADAGLRTAEAEQCAWGMLRTLVPRARPHGTEYTCHSSA